MTKPVDKPKKPRGLAAMSPEKAAAIRAKGAFTSKTASESGAEGRRKGNLLRKAAPALLTAVEALYGLAKSKRIPESHPVMIGASEAVKLARGETKEKDDGNATTNA